MNDRKLISSGSPFEKAYGYSRAVVSGDEVHIAGTTGYDYAKMAMPDDVAEQTRNIYATFAAVMKEAGGGLADIVRLRTFVTDSRVFRCRLEGPGRGVRSDPPSGDDDGRLGAVEAGNEGRDRGRRAASTDLCLLIAAPTFRGLENLLALRSGALLLLRGRFGLRRGLRLSRSARAWGG